MNEKRQFCLQEEERKSFCSTDYKSHIHDRLIKFYINISLAISSSATEKKIFKNTKIEFYYKGREKMQRMIIQFYKKEGDGIINL